jgi:hypothetical protein
MNYSTVQYSTYKLNQIAEKCNFRISTKTEVMTFKGKDPVRIKIVINGRDSQPFLNGDTPYKTSAIP